MEVKYTRNIIKLELVIVIFALFFAMTFNVNGTNIIDDESTSNNIREKINERTIFIPDTDIVIIVWNEIMDSGEILPFYSISLDGGNTIVRTVQADYELGLRYDYFDPLVETPSDRSLPTPPINCSIKASFTLSCPQIEGAIELINLW